MQKKNPLDDNDKSLKQAAKKGLKTMQKTRAKHPLREQGRIVKYGTSSFLRNFWLSSAATAVMVVTLVILFVTVVASVILNNTAEAMREKIDTTIYFKPNTSEEKLAELTEIIKTDSNVKSVTVSTSEQEYEKFLEENAESDDILNVLDDDMRQMMIGKMQATMRIKVYNTENLNSIRELVKTNPVFVENLDEKLEPTYDVNQIEIATITSWARIARTGGFVLAGVFLAISVLIIFSTIRMAIFSRREEIYMMKLVGADKRFIRGPFIVEAEICGIIAGVIAATVSYFAFVLLAPKIANYGINADSILEILQSNQLILVYLVFILLGVVVGRLSARLAISKYLNKS